MGIKLCSRCGEWKAPGAFYPNRGWADGLHPYCRLCLLAYKSARRRARLDEADPLRRRWSRYLVRHEYFARVDAPIKAYVLGLLAADGNVLDKRNRISLELAAKDGRLVELVRDELAPGYSVRSRTRRNGQSSIVLAITSAKLAADLARLGVTPKKSLTLRWPQLPRALERPFLLGYFDGDGYTTVSRDRTYRYPRWGILGTEHFVSAAMNVIAVGTGIRRRDPRPRGGIWTLQITGADAAIVDVWLHDGFDFGLARKRVSSCAA